MARVIPLGAIPDSLVFPDCLVRFKTTSLEPTTTKENEEENKKAKLMYVAKFKVVEPKQFAGLPYTHRFTIGTEDDPDADLLETWQTSMGGRSLKRYTKAINVPFGDEESEETFCKQVEGSEFVATVIQKTQTKEGKYKGQVQNDITAFWQIGEKEPGLIEGSKTTASASAAKAAGKTTAGKPAAQPKAAPSDEVVCTACPKGAPKVKKAELRAHVDKHMADMAAAAGGGGDTDEE